MMKEMLSKIMKRAWEIKREDSRNIFSLCLKMAWAEIKKGCNKMINKLKEVLPMFKFTTDEKYIYFTARATMKYGEYKNFQFSSELGNVKIEDAVYNKDSKTMTATITSRRELEESVEKMVRIIKRMPLYKIVTR